MIKSFLNGSFWMIAGNLASKMVALFLNAAIVRLITPAEYGTYSLYYGYMLLFIAFSNFGISIAVQRISAKSNSIEKSEISERISTALFCYLFIALIVTISLLLFEGSIGTYLFNNNFNSIFYRLTIILFLFNSISNLPLDILIGFKSFKKYALRIFFSIY